MGFYKKISDLESKLVVLKMLMGKDMRTKEVRAIKKQIRELWCSATEDDLKIYAKRDAEEFPNLGDYEHNLEDAKKNQELIRERMKKIKKRKKG